MSRNILCHSEIKINFILNLNKKLLRCHPDRREGTGDFTTK